MLQFGLPLIESYLDKLSSWNQGLMLKFLEKVSAFKRIQSYEIFFKGLLFQSALPN